MAEQLERLALQLGQENMEKLMNSTVLIVGIGGVGSYACESLARSGVGHLRLIDHDEVELSNLNRQIMATYDTLHMNKCEAMKQRIATYNANCEVEGYQVFFDENSSQLLDGVDFVIDAIDTVSSKVVLYEMCLERNIPFISSLGMGNRMDPSQLEVSELMKTQNDPLARAVRNRVRKQRLKGKIPVIISKELPFKQSIVVDENATTRKQAMPPASSVFVPATAGLIAGSVCVKTLLGKD